MSELPRRITAAAAPERAFTSRWVGHLEITVKCHRRMCVRHGLDGAHDSDTARWLAGSRPFCQLCRRVPEVKDSSRVVPHTRVGAGPTRRTRKYVRSRSPESMGIAGGIVGVRATLCRLMRSPSLSFSLFLLPSFFAFSSLRKNSHRTHRACCIGRLRNSFCAG